MDQAFMEILGGIAKDQLPQLASKALSDLAEKEEVKKNPVTAVVVKIAIDWNEKHGPHATGELFHKLEKFIAEGGKDVIALQKDLSAENLTALTDAMQSAEKKQQAQARADAVRLGLNLGRFGRIFARAVIAATLGA